MKEGRCSMAAPKANSLIHCLTSMEILSPRQIKCKCYYECVSQETQTLVYEQTEDASLPCSSEKQSPSSITWVILHSQSSSKINFIRNPKLCVLFCCLLFFLFSMDHSEEPMHCTETCLSFCFPSEEK